MAEGTASLEDRGTDQRPLAAGFDAPTESEWLALVDKVLKGAPLSRLDSKTPGGLDIVPLYTDEDLPDDLATEPGVSPFTRGAHRVAEEAPQWAIRFEVSETDTGSAAQVALEALERGATEITLVIDGSQGLPSRPGVALGGVDDLDVALEGVMLDLAPVYLRAGAGFLAAAGWLRELWKRRGVDVADASGGFGADPIGALAASAVLGQGIDSALADLSDLAERTAAEFPTVRSVSVDTTPYVNAGADEVEELAIMLSTGAAYLRSCSATSLGIDDACDQIEVTLNLDADVFTGVAKLRAARRLWDALCVSCGASAGSSALRLNARTAEPMMTRRDPWVNLLRVTAASMAAALGDVDSLTTLPYDLRLDSRGELGRRMLRNTQLLLQEESNLSRVADPMGGSWYIESLTHQLIEKAWARFQELEASGGMPGVLLDGSLARTLAAGVEERMARIGKRKEPITGVSEFPNLDEEPVAQSVAQSVAARQKSAAAIAAVDEGADSATRIDPLRPVHWAERFEELRDRSDLHLERTRRRPRVFLVNLGPVAKHTARATFARNFFATGGVDAVTSEIGSSLGFSEPSQAIDDAKASQSDAVCICSSDDIYAEQAVEVATALKAAGLGPVYVAGKPGESEAALRSAGVDEFIYIGVDVLDILTRLHHQIETPELNR